MITFKELFEAKDAGGHGSEKHHVMSFARMNPPTTGHMEVINKLHAVAKEHNAPHSLIVSHSQDAKKNPLSAEQKIKHIKRYSPETNVHAASKEAPTILHHAAQLHKQGVQHLHVVAGSDRHKEMHDLLHKYNTGEEHKHGSFKFKSITMHSSGERDPDSEGTSGMSGTKMREHAHAGNFKEFRKGVPSHVSDKHAHELMKDVRHGSGIKEEAISYKTFMEARMSAAVKLQRAFEREQQKSAASRERAKQLLAPKKPEPVKEETIDETIVKVDSGYEVQSHTGKNLGKSPTLAGAKKRLRQVEYFKHVKEDMEFEDTIAESVHNNRTGFAKRHREDDEYHNGGDPKRHVYKYNVSKPGVNDGKKHERHVTTPMTTRPKHELEHLARAHLTKQGYQIHEDVNSRGPYKQKSPVVVAPKDPKAKTYGKIVSKLRPVAEERVSKHKDLGATKDTKHFVKNMTTGEVISPHRTRADAHEGLRAAEADGEHGHKFKVVRAIHEEFISEGAYEKAEENKKSADSAKAQGDMFAHHLHMADHHDNMSEWHGSKGRHGEADRHAQKAEEHHEKAMSLKEEVESLEETELQESMTDSWKRVQSMDKGSITGGKEQVKKHLAYLHAVHAHHKKFGNDTKKVKGQIERINRSRIAEENETQENEMGLKSFSTLVKEGTLQSSGDDSIPTLTDAPANKVEENAPVAPTIPRKYIKGTPEWKAHKEKSKPINGHPTGKYNEEVEIIDEAYAKVETKKYSWGTMKTAHHGASFSVPMHPEHHKAIHGLKDQQEHKFKTEDGRHWTAKRQGDDVHLHSANDGPKTKIKHSDLKEEVEQIEERNKENATKRKMMDASRGARFKLNNPVPDAEPEHKTAQAHNKAIGRALRKEDAEQIEEVAPAGFEGTVKAMKKHKEIDNPWALANWMKNKGMKSHRKEDGTVKEAVAEMTPVQKDKPVAPKNKKPAVNSDLVNAAGQEPHEETFEKAPKPVRKESFSVSDLFQALKEGMWPGTPEYKAKYDGAKQGGGSGIKKGSRYGGSLQKDEPETDHDDAPKAGRKVGSKSGARKNLGNSKLHK